MQVDPRIFPPRPPLLGECELGAGIPEKYGDHLSRRNILPVKVTAPAHASLGHKAAPLPALQPPSTRDPLRFGKLPVKVAVPLINAEFFVLRSSGKIYRDDDDGELKAIPKPDFGTALAGRVVEIVDADGNTKTKPAATAWIESPDRREYIGVQYCPEGRGLKPNYKNLWGGWGVNAGEGDCSIVLDHVLHIVAGGNQAKADFLLRWMADILQNPTRKPGVCVVLRGSQGCGKSVVSALLRKVLGPKNVLVTSEKDRILGRFNAPVANKILLVGEEMLFAGDRATTDKLKHLITGDSIQLEMKFGDQIEINSCHRLLLTSNHQQVIQAASEERRFVIFDVSDAKRGDTDYFDRLYAVADGRDDATAAAFMKFLIESDLTDFRPWHDQQAFAVDAALKNQKVLSLSPPLLWLKEVIDTVDGEGPAAEYDWVAGLPHPAGQLYGQSRQSKWPPRFPRSEALAAFREWATKARLFGAAEYTGSPERFWAEICKIIPRAQTNYQVTGGVRTVSITLADVEANLEKYLEGRIV